MSVLIGRAKRVWVYSFDLPEGPVRSWFAARGWKTVHQNTDAPPLPIELYELPSGG